MKKALSLFMVCLLVMSFAVMAVVPASAASPKEAIVDALKEYVPAEYLDKHLPTVENILQQLEITEEQAAGVVGCIVAADEAVDDHHHSLHLFTAEEREAVLEQLDKACKILSVRYELKMSDDPKHAGDQVAVFYKADGTKLADVDFDPVKKTSTPNDVNVEFIVLAVLLMAAAITTAVYAKKVVAR